MKSKYFLAGLIAAVLFVLVCVPFVFFADYNSANVALFLACFFVVVVLPVFVYCEECGLLDDSDK